MELPDKIRLLPDGTCNTYLIDDEKKVLVDAGVDYGGRVEVILLTHGHKDHITYLKKIMDQNPECVVYIGIKETELLIKQGVEVGKRFKGAYEGKTVIETGSYAFEVIEVPAHTKGSIAFFDEENKVLFCGDTLFKHGVGRTDFPESIPDFMDNAVTMLVGLDTDIILPGHGEPFNVNELDELKEVTSKE